MSRPKLIYRETIEHNTAPAWPAQVHQYGSGMMRFSIETTRQWRPHVDVLPENVPGLVRALAQHLGWRVEECPSPATVEVQS